MKQRILILNPLKDIPHWGLTTHAVNVFSRFPAARFEIYGFFNNPSFAQGPLKQIPLYVGWRGVRHGISAVRSLKPDVLYGTGAGVELFFYLCRPKNAKYVIAWHGPYDKHWLLDIGNYSLKAHLSYYIATYLLSRADLFFCDSEFIAGSLREHFPETRTIVTLNGVDGEFYSPKKQNKKWLAEKFSIASDRPTFLFVGHLIRRKRPEIFVALARRFPQAYFVMIGREGLYTKENVAEWEASAKNLKWVPSSISREEMPILFASASGLVFPSLDEPFGFAVIEAMASGIVVFGARSGALPELVKDKEEGFLIPLGQGEMDNYANALGKILKGGPLIAEMKKKARAKAEAVFDWSGVACRYEVAFNGLYE
jgi:glycosyltransferase involved in cell wall biosynthesis